MARPGRHTVDYYPREVNHGKKMHVIESKFGNDGYAVWSKLLDELGKADNHYLDINDETTWMYLDTKLGVGSGEVMAILECLVALKVIHAGLWSKKIIFIQKFTDGVDDAYKRRTNKCWQLTDICKHLGIKCKHKPCWCGVCVDGNPQSKVKEIKGKEIKGDNQPIQNFILQNCPRVSTIERQLTLKEEQSLRANYHDLLIKRKLFAMENKKNLGQYNSVYLTLQDWCSNDFNASKNGELKQLYKQPKWVEEQMESENGWAEFAAKNPKMAKKFTTIGKEEKINT